MAHLLLPTGHTDRDRRLAERIAVSLKSDELVVCRLNSTPRPAPRRPRPAPPPKPAAASTLVAELAVGLAFIWEAVIALGERGRARVASR
jgi:hypothetical protein